MRQHPIQEKLDLAPQFHSETEYRRDKVDSSAEDNGLCFDKGSLNLCRNRVGRGEEGCVGGKVDNDHYSANCKGGFGRVDSSKTSNGDVPDYQQGDSCDVNGPSTEVMHNVPTRSSAHDVAACDAEVHVESAIFSHSVGLQAASLIISRVCKVRSMNHTYYCVA